jgi:hypothetical protein
MWARSTVEAQENHVRSVWSLKRGWSSQARGLRTVEERPKAAPKLPFSATFSQVNKHIWLETFQHLTGEGNALVSEKASPKPGLPGATSGIHFVRGRPLLSPHVKAHWQNRKSQNEKREQPFSCLLKGQLKLFEISSSMPFLMTAFGLLHVLRFCCAAGLAGFATPCR